MIGNSITSPESGEPLDNKGNRLAVSAYQPPEEIKKLWARVQTDYNQAWRLQHRPFNEFDGISLLDRARLDQQTFGAFVGLKFNNTTKDWRWKGRKNTTRNKLIGILAHVISGMLFPFCYAYNDEDKEDKMTAQVMRILIEDHLKKAEYEIKFLFAMCSALVNPAVLCEVEYVEAFQKIKIKDENGKYRIEEAVDELLSGINLNIVPIDQLLLADFYTFNLQRQPYLIRIKRISYDEARSIYAGKYFIDTGEGLKDQFDYVQAGQTRVMLAGQENQTLYDIEWTEGDRNYVQVLTIAYRPEDLEVDFVGGVYMGEYDSAEPKAIYNCNPFKHRRMSQVNGKWASIPIYNFAKSGFEPLDPSGRFAYYKSAAAKGFWDDAAINKMHQLAFDGTFLDVFKPMFLSGVAKVDQSVLTPGSTTAMPMGAAITPYALGPNLMAALQMLQKETQDLSESTQDAISNGQAQQNVTATAVNKAQQQAQVDLGVFGIMIMSLVIQIGELVMDDILLHTTIGEIDATIPESLNMKYKTVITRGQEKGKDVTNKIQFSTQMMDITPEKADELEWKMFKDAGGMHTTQRNFMVDPYKFARQKFSLFIDPDVIISRSMGTDQLRKARAFQMLMDPLVMPYINVPVVIKKFAVDDFSDGDPDELMNPNPPQGVPGQQPPQGQGQPDQQNSMANSIMGMGQGQPQNPIVAAASAASQ